MIFRPKCIISAGPNGTFDRNLEESIGHAVPVVRDVPLISTDGNDLLLDAEGWRGVGDLIDGIWYLDVTDDERQLRPVRCHEAFGKSHGDAETWAKGSDQRTADVIDATRERVDLIITLTSPPTVNGNQRPVAVGHREGERAGVRYATTCGTTVSTRVPRAPTPSTRSAPPGRMSDQPHPGA